MTEENKTEVKKDPEAEAKAAEKDTKGKIDAFYEVTKHKLGRPPTMEEIVSAMQEGAINPSEHPESQQVLMPGEEAPQEAPVEDQGPAILRMKIYHGMKDSEDGTREPDPANILFYETPEQLVYDTKAQAWLGDRPDIVNHLPSREMNYDENDMISAIIHGVMSDDDYEQLSGAGMMQDNPQRLWDLTKKLNGQIEELERSKDVDKSAMQDLEKSEESDEDPMEDSGSESADSSDSDSDSQPAPVETSSEVPEQETQGSDMVAEIVKTAMAEALAGPYLEQTIRKIVREETGRGSSEEPQSAPIDNGE